MKPRYAFAALAATLVAGAASAQYVPATYQQPYCREFTKVVTIGGQAQSAYGQACRQPDGSWQIVSDDIPSNQPVTYYPESNYVAYQPPVYAAPAPYYAPQPVYYTEPSPVFSLSFNSWSPNRTRYYNDHGHGWRDWDRGPRGHDRDHGDHGPGRGRGHDRH